MSIRLKILFSLLVSLVLAAAVSGLVGVMALNGQAELAGLSDKALSAGEASRSAREHFDRAERLIARVTAMTDLIDPTEIDSTFKAASAAAGRDLTHLAQASFSAEMTKLSRQALADFEGWKRDAEVLLGLAKAQAIPSLDRMGRRSRALRATLNDAVVLAAHDARTSMADASAGLRTRLLVVFAVAGMLAIVAAAFAAALARSLSRPLVALVANARQLAAGDVSVQLNALQRRDEIGEIARAINLFRENVASQIEAERQAATDRATSDEEKALNEAFRSSAEREQAGVVEAVGLGLSALASGNLTHRIEADFPLAYRALKSNFNEAVSKLEQTVATIASTALGIQAGTTEISRAGDDLSRRTEQQAASLAETAISLDEMTAMVRKTADGANHVRDVVGSASRHAAESSRVVEDAVCSMSQISRSSVQISQIIGVIDEIAFQTNLLALNAGVEAARAGETGKGFAVVASEVRALAQRSADAAKEIKGLIQVSGKQVQEGVELVGRAGQALARILAEVAEINGIVVEIAGSAKEQATGLGEVNAAVSQMDQVTRQNAAMVEETTSAGRSLADEAGDLGRLMTLFKVSGPAGARPAQGTPARTTAQRLPARRGRVATLGNLALKPDQAEDWAEF